MINLSGVVINANPHCYDYVHQLSLFPNAKCSFVDGGEQLINGKWNGTWKFANNVLKLIYNEYDNYENLEYIDPISIEIGVKITDEYTKFFDGYCLSASDQTWEFTKSPCPSFVNQQYNLYNLLEEINEQNTPLKFYKLIHGYKTKNEILNGPYLNFTRQRIWTVSSLDDDVPLIKSIKSGFIAKRIKMENVNQYVKNFIEKNKQHVPFIVDIINDQYDTIYSKRLIYEYYDGNKTNNEDVNTFFKNIKYLEEMHRSKFIELYKKLSDLLKLIQRR